MVWCLSRRFPYIFIYRHVISILNIRQTSSVGRWPKSKLSRRETLPVHRNTTTIPAKSLTTVQTQTFNISNPTKSNGTQLVSAPIKLSLAQQSVIELNRQVWMLFLQIYAYIHTYLSYLIWFGFLLLSQVAIKLLQKHRPSDKTKEFKSLCKPKLEYGNHRLEQLLGITSEISFKLPSGFVVDCNDNKKQQPHIIERTSTVWQYYGRSLVYL